MDRCSSRRCFGSKIVEDGLEKIYSEIELPLIAVLADIEIAGMKVDGEALQRFSDLCHEELDELQTKISTRSRDANSISARQNRSAKYLRN